MICANCNLDDNKDKDPNDIRCSRCKFTFIEKTSDNYRLAICKWEQPFEHLYDEVDDD